MAKGHKKATSVIEEVAALSSQELRQNLSLGAFAYQVIDEQHHHVVKQEKHVLTDKNPEHLHQMRVGSRRLYTALQVFGNVVELPKAAQEKHVRFITKVLGKLRDLDVQIASLRNDYQPQIQSQSERHSLEEALVALEKQRRKAFAGVEDTLKRSRYQDLKEAYKSWLGQPHYSLLAQLQLVPVLPNLLNPLLSTLLLHPAWLISPDDLSEENITTLHDLRKACKHARYQADFFVDFYGQPFKEWIKEIKELQEILGKLQDIQVLRKLLAKTLDIDVNLRGNQQSNSLEELDHLITQQQQQALIDWETFRQKYLEGDYRMRLHRLLLDEML